MTTGSFGTGGVLLVSLTIGAALSGCGRGPEPARDVAESSAATDVLGRPADADSTPPRTTDRPPDEPPSEGRPTTPARPAPDDSIKRPERRPIRNIPPLTEPDSGRP